MKNAYKEKWLKILEIDKLKENSNFFEIGGNSILALRLAFELSLLFKDVDVIDIFKYPKFNDLYEYLLNKKEKVIELKNVFKSFEIKKGFIRRKKEVVEALKNINFEMYEGEIVALIGPNGAGKSTFIKLVSGILRANSGKILLFNNRTKRHQSMKNIGMILGQKSQLNLHLPIIDSFKLHAAVYDIKTQEMYDRIEKIDPYLRIKPFLKTPSRKLSLGQRMRCDIGLALLHSPKILLLDEPTIGLDYVTKRDFRVMLNELVKFDKIAILLTSHDLNDIEEMGDKILLLHKGEILFNGYKKELREIYRAGKEMTILYKTGNKDLSQLWGSIFSQFHPKFDNEKGSVTLFIPFKDFNMTDILNKIPHKQEVVDVSVIDTKLENILDGAFQ